MDKEQFWNGLTKCIHPTILIKAANTTVTVGKQKKLYMIYKLCEVCKDCDEIVSDPEKQESWKSHFHSVLQYKKEQKRNGIMFSER